MKKALNEWFSPTRTQIGGNVVNCSVNFWIEGSALPPMDDDEHPQRARARSTGRKQVLSDDDKYLTNVVGVAGCKCSS